VKAAHTLQAPLPQQLQQPGPSRVHLCTHRWQVERCMLPSTFTVMIGMLHYSLLVLLHWHHAHACISYVACSLENRRCAFSFVTLGLCTNPTALLAFPTATLVLVVLWSYPAAAARLMKMQWVRSDASSCSRLLCALRCKVVHNLMCSLWPFCVSGCHHGDNKSCDGGQQAWR
jgi:hypothetical protein